MKAIITLRSGREIEQPVPITAEETCKEKEAEPERIIISEDPVKKTMPPPFPQALRGKKKIPNQAEIWEVLRQVKVNIPLLDMIKQVPTYAKFLRDLCHAPDPGPTRLANPNRFRGAKPYTGTPFFFFFFRADLISVVYK